MTAVTSNQKEIMSRIRDVLKGNEQRSPRKKNGSADAIPKVIGPEPILIARSQEFAPQASVTEPIFVTRTPDLDPTQNQEITETALVNRCAMTWKPDSRTMLFLGTDEQAPGRENFRTLRSRLHLLREAKPLKRVLVTSSLPKEGRSFVAANLAQIIARQQGSRALLIDADLRNPRLHSALGTAAAPGLSEYLEGQADELGIIQRGLIDNLFFIPSGQLVRGQAEAISNGRLKLLLDQVSPLFDWIIVDSPAVMPVSDGVLIASLCDGVLIVVRSHSTPFDVVRKTRQQFRDEQLLGVVLNGIPTELQAGNNGYHNGSDPKFKP